MFNMRLIFLQPKVIVSANYGVEPGKLVPYKPLLDGALKMISFHPQKCIIYNRPGVSKYRINFFPAGTVKFIVYRSVSGIHDWVVKVVYLKQLSPHCGGVRTPPWTLDSF
jgi:acyl-coenzyme A synthetase/AMP-(fatty) acid ligase